MNIVDIQEKGDGVFIRMDQSLPQGSMAKLQRIYAGALSKHGDDALHIQDGGLLLSKEFALEFQQKSSLDQLVSAVDEAYRQYTNEFLEEQARSKSLLGKLRAAAGLPA